jgi:hypothetical protein
VDRAVVAAHESTVDQPHNMKGYAILSVHHISHGPGHVQAEYGDERWRVRRRSPRSCCGASFCAHVGSTRSWSKHAHIQGFKGVVWAYTTASIERGRHGARRRAGTGAAACAEGKMIGKTMLTT